MKEYKCEECGLTEWNNKKISLELHHIDGDRTNNIIENLQLLCPNCHSQTKNFRSKKLNGRKIINTIDDINDINVKMNIIKKEKVKKEKETKKLYICPICGEKSDNKKFCSIKCYNEYQSKNIASKEELLLDINELKSKVQIGKKYNVSDNAVKKWFIRYNIN